MLSCLPTFALKTIQFLPIIAKFFTHLNFFKIIIYYFRYLFTYFKDLPLLLYSNYIQKYISDIVLTNYSSIPMPIYVCIIITETKEEKMYKRKKKEAK